MLFRLFLSVFLLWTTGCARGSHLSPAAKPPREPVVDQGNSLEAPLDLKIYTYVLILPSSVVKRLVHQEVSTKPTAAIEMSASRLGVVHFWIEQGELSVHEHHLGSASRCPLCRVAGLGDFADR